MSPIFLATNSEAGIFGICRSKRGTTNCNFQTGNSRRQCYKSDNKFKAAWGRSTLFPLCSFIL